MRANADRATLSRPPVDTSVEITRKAESAGDRPGACESGWPGGDRPADLPLVPGWVFDPAEPPAVLLSNRRQLRRTGGARFRDEVVRVVDHQQHSARGAPIGTGT